MEQTNKQMGSLSKNVCSKLSLTSLHPPRSPVKALSIQIKIIHEERYINYIHRSFWFCKKISNKFTSQLVNAEITRGIRKPAMKMILLFTQKLGLMLNLVSPDILPHDIGYMFPDKN